MKMFFEYFYYRMANLNKNNSYEVPTLGLTATQFILIINIVFFVYTGPFEIKGKTSAVEYIVYLSFFFGLDYYNNKLYKGKFEEFDKRWTNESNKDKLIGMIKIISFIIFCWGLIFINGWIYNRYE